MRGAWPRPLNPVRAAATGCSCLQVLLVPVLYLVMELTMRLGVATGKGHAQLTEAAAARRPLAV